MSLREKIEGNELDLSLNQLKEIPVKDLAAASKATHLDLSCNLIESLPSDFSTLTHLVKIDLSKNKLTELPSNFGNLVNLQYLDLYGNQLTSLPVSFCKLKNLKWLDLKNNPLDKTLSHVAGDCLNEKECQSCAKKVVAFMQSINSELERERQKQIKAAREKEAIERAKVEAKLEEQRRLKKLEKEKRKAESRAKKEAQILNENSQPNNSSQPKSTHSKNDVQKAKAPETSGISCGRIFLYSFLAVSLLFLCFPIGWEIYSKNYTKEDVLKIIGKAQATSFNYISQVAKFIVSKIPIVKEFFLKLVHRYMSNMTYYASEVERILAVYF